MNVHSMKVQLHRRVSLGEAEARLSELILAVESGETVDITRRGERVATLSPVRPSAAPIDVAWLQRVTDSMPYGDAEACDLVRQMRDDARY